MQSAQLAIFKNEDFFQAQCGIKHKDITKLFDSYSFLFLQFDIKLKDLDNKPTYRLSKILFFILAI